MKLIYLLMLLFCSIGFAQNTVSGIITDTKQQPLYGANVILEGTDTTATTGFDGKFALKSDKDFPWTLIVSSVGSETQRVQLKSNTSTLKVALADSSKMLNEIVISASRAPERIFESPVTIERMGITEIRKSASPTFYDGLENLKEVQMNTSSLAFKSVNTRGFATVANTRFMQLVDGMDNSSPLLNFVLGNMIGISELDVQSVELLPGASSALYGANAFNGILFMNSKDPFKYQGTTAYVKTGFTNQNAAGANEFVDAGVRVAHAFSDKFAVKANFTMLSGTDWNATDYRDKDLVNNAGLDRSYYNYNGVNVYGDEASTNLNNVADGLLAANAITSAQHAAFKNVLPNYNVSRTGYNETDLTDSKVKNLKLDAGLYYRPFGNDFEISWLSKIGYGNAIYQGANRYYLNNFMMQQHKLEFKGKNFFVRGYFTTEDGGESYDMQFTGLNVNRKWKPDSQWFGEYAATYATSVLGGATNDQAHAAARTVADTDRLSPGTAAFKTAFNEVIADPDVLTGSKLVDNSYIYHSDANYNFRDQIKWAEIQVGGSFRLYELNSFGRIYTDADGQINYNEYGFYTQLQKKLLADKLKFTGSVRYDKAKNFDGNYSPRISLVYSAGANENHIFRLSFQRGFRNPTTQDQYIGFNVGPAVLLGSAPDNLERYSETINGYTINGRNAYYNSYTVESVAQFSALAGSNPVAAAALLQKSDYNLVRPETVNAFELGYRTQFEKLSIDANTYYNVYNNFIGNVNVVAPLFGTAQDAPNVTLGATDPGAQSVSALATGNTRVFQLYTNTDIEIKSIGVGLGLTYQLPSNFELSANYNYAQFNFDQSQDPNFEAGFNTPKHRVKASISNDKLIKNIGFNISGRWSDEYLWQSTFADGMIDAATVLDAQISYNLTKFKSTIKLGAANLFGKEYQQVLGAGAIGQQYFLSLTVNP
jgi:outer membrane receptor protein involved in Fe transport